MPFLGESQRHTLQDIGELLLELHQLIDAQSKSIAKFGQQSLTEEAPNSLDARSSQQPTWHTRPPDVQPTTSQESAGRWRPPPSLTVADITSLEALEAQPYMRTEAPLFNGDDPLGWIFGIQAYFNYFFTDESVRLAVVEKLIEQPASDWFYYYQQTNVDGSWEDFLVAVHHRFAPELIEDDVLQVIDENQLVAQSSNKESKNIVTNGISSQTMICDGSSETNRKDAYKFDDIVVNTIFDYGDIVVKAGDIVINDAFDSGQPTCAMEIGEINEVDSFICIDSSKSYSELGCLSVEAELQLPNCIMDDGNSQVETRHIRGVSGDAAGLLDLYGDARTIPPRDTFPNRECGEADDDDHQRLTERCISQSTNVIISKEMINVDEYGDDDQSDNSYKRWQNPTKSCRISDPEYTLIAKIVIVNSSKDDDKEFSSSRALSGHMRRHSIKNKKEVYFFKKCGRGFEAMRATLDHMKSRSQKVMKVFSVDETGMSLSALGNFCLIQRKKSMMKSANASHIAAFELDEAEEADRCLVISFFKFVSSAEEPQLTALARYFILETETMELPPMDLVNDWRHPKRLVQQSQGVIHASKSFLFSGSAPPPPENPNSGKQLFHSNGEAASPDTFQTPHRIMIHVDILMNKQFFHHIEVDGPPTSKAIVQPNNPTKVAAGFWSTNGFVGEPVAQRDSVDIVSCAAIADAHDELVGNISTETAMSYVDTFLEFTEIQACVHWFDCDHEDSSTHRATLYVYLGHSQVAPQIGELGSIPMEDRAHVLENGHSFQTTRDVHKDNKALLLITIFTSTLRARWIINRGGVDRDSTSPTALQPIKPTQPGCLQQHSQPKRMIPKLIRYEDYVSK